MKSLPFLLAGAETYSENILEVFNPYSKELIKSVSLATPDQLELALESGTKARKEMASLKAWQKSDILASCSQQLSERKEEFAQLITSESGKPITASRSEVDRAISTFKFAQHEANNQYGEILPMDTRQSSQDYQCLTKRVPLGLCLFISPFNFPLNLIVHKVAPAIAAGCPFIIKPSDKTPLTALLLGDILAKSELPKSAFSILPCSIQNSYKLIEDDRPSFLSFTGSSQIGWEIKNKARRKKVSLELGGTATCSVLADANFDEAIERIVFGSFYQSGQSCISVQRVLIDKSIYSEFKNKLIEKTKLISHGDPIDENTFIGPIITQSSADRIRLNIQSAIKQGANLLTPSLGDEKNIPACILENVPSGHHLITEEIFGPVITIEPFTDRAQLIDLLNDSKFAIHTGLFTNDLKFALHCWDVLESTGVIIGDIPSWRADNMPYGGSKESGIGREGLRYAIEEMTEIKTLILKQ